MRLPSVVRYRTESGKRGVPLNFFLNNAVGEDHQET